MRTRQTPQTEFTRNLPLRRWLCPVARGPLVLLALCAAPLSLTGPLLAAQTNPAAAAAASPTHKSVHPHKQPAAVHSTVVQPAAQPVTPPAPAQPKTPDWPASDPPAAASVVWDSHGLLIVASNSSLAQILKEVATDTGAKVEGMDTDQRVFGTYGPGPARDVLSQLLDGSGYNLLLIGDRGQGTPRRIVLSIRTGGGIQRTANNTPSAPSEEDTEADEQAQEPPEPPQPEPVQNGAAPLPVRTPQTIEEMRDRSRQIEQLQNGQQNPQN